MCKQRAVSDYSTATTATQTGRNDFSQAPSTFVSDFSGNEDEYPDVSFIMRQETANGKARALAFQQYREQGGETARDAPLELGTAKIIFTYKEQCNFYCEKVCLKHTHFLVRVRPAKGEEWFCTKKYEDFQKLHHLIHQGDMRDVTRFPVLPDGKTPRISIFGRFQCGQKLNPQMWTELQSFLDTLTSQVVDFTTEPVLSAFFQADQVPSSDPLVQKAVDRRPQDALLL